MDVTSFPFFIFVLALMILMAAFSSKSEVKKSLLLIASYYFYMTLDWRFAGLLLVLTLVNYGAGRVITRYSDPKVQKLSLIVSVSVSLSLLFYFKYFGFFIDSLYSLLTHFGLTGRSLVVEVVLPIGISFMTFQAITYPIDLKRGDLEKATSLKNFSLFMAFFPQLLSGPIVRASYFMPQLENNAKATGSDLIEGMTFVLRGLVKKILIADVLAVHIVDPAFASPSDYSSAFLVLALFAYGFQVYMDLSGYTDIAIGVAKMLGYKLPVNFNRPYLATSIANFWQRWHITMSSFFRDYLYEAIKNAQFGNTYVHLWIVFVAIGIWHGAGWNFVLYGFIHGSLVGWEHFRQQRRKDQGLAPKTYRGINLFLKISQVFLIVTATRLLFRGDDLSFTFDFIEATLFSIHTDFPLSSQGAIAMLLAAFLHFTPTSMRDAFMRTCNQLPSILYAGGVVLLSYVFVAMASNQAGFIYFQF